LFLGENLPSFTRVFCYQLPNEIHVMLDADNGVLTLELQQKIGCELGL